jgi:hypothetical protein
MSGDGQEQTDRPSAFFSWWDYYWYKRIGVSKLAQRCNLPWNKYDNMSTYYKCNEDELLDFVEKYTDVFLLLPGRNGTVMKLHNCTVIDDDGKKRIMGIFGNSYISPLKCIDPVEATAALKARPFNWRGTERLDAVPSLLEFLNCRNGGEISLLRPTIDSDSSVLLFQGGNSFWLHPEVYLKLPDPRHENAGVLAYDILQVMGATIPDVDGDDEGTNDILEQLHRLVVFLWAVAIGLTFPLVLSDAPETTEVEEIYAKMCGHMEKSRIAQRRNQPDAFAYELEHEEAPGARTGTDDSEEDDWEFHDSKLPAKRRR